MRLFMSPLVQGKDRIVSGPDKSVQHMERWKAAERTGIRKQDRFPPTHPRLISIESQGRSTCSASDVGRGPVL